MNNADDEDTGKLPEGDEPTAGSTENEETARSPEGEAPAAERFSSRNLAIAGASIAAAIVAALLFLVPGDRVLGLDSDGSHRERSHDRDRDHDGFEHHGPEGSEGHGPDFHGGPGLPPPDQGAEAYGDDHDEAGSDDDQDERTGPTGEQSQTPEADQGGNAG
jgi:hypothetical protein